MSWAGMEIKQQIKQLTGRDVYVPEYEDVKKSDRVNSAGRASYVERNYWMIDDSKFSIFYYQKSPSKSGTYLAYQYAETKNEGCINLKG